MKSKERAKYSWSGRLIHSLGCHRLKGSIPQSTILYEEQLMYFEQVRSSVFNEKLRLVV